MSTNTPSRNDAPKDTTAERPQRWVKPRFVERRLGFEVTMYFEYR